MQKTRGSSMTSEVNGKLRQRIRCVTAIGLARACDRTLSCNLHIKAQTADRELSTSGTDLKSVKSYHLWQPLLPPSAACPSPLHSSSCRFASAWNRGTGYLGGPRTTTTSPYLPTTSSRPAPTPTPICVAPIWGMSYITPPSKTYPTQEVECRNYPHPSFVVYFWEG
eukprot:550748-Hanusia_phi.AAC.2